MKTFPDFQDKYGTTPAQIRASVDQAAIDTRAVNDLADDLGTDISAIPFLTTGLIVDPLQQGPRVAHSVARQLSADSYIAIAIVKRWANDADAFDTSVDELNTQLIADSRLDTFTRGLPTEEKELITAGDARNIVYARLLPQYNKLLNDLETAASVAETSFENPDQVSVRDLFRQGLIPLSAASVFPDLTLTPADLTLIGLLNGLVDPDELAGLPVEEITTWWLALPPAQRQDLIRQQPQIIGNLNGIPVVDRDAANRITLDESITEMQNQLDALGPEPRLEIMAGFRYGNREEYDAWHEAYERLTGLIKGSEDIRTRLESGAEPPYYLIGYRPDEGNGQAIVSRGNPDTSDYVTTFIPGTTSRLEGINGDIGRSDTLRDRMLLKTDGTVATITWYDYEAPQSVFPEAASQDWAKEGGPTLSDFSHALRATHIGEPSYNNFQAHSYGGTTMGYAATHGNELDADSVTFVATPGVGVGNLISSADVTDLDLGDHSGEGRTYATRSESDPIKWVEGLTLGTQPVSHYFGAQVFESDPDGGHSDYWDRGNPGLDAMAMIGVGRGSEVDPVDTTPPAVEMVGP